MHYWVTERERANLGVVVSKMYFVAGLLRGPPCHSRCFLDPLDCFVYGCIYQFRGFCSYDDTVTMDERPKYISTQVKSIGAAAAAFYVWWKNTCSS